MNKNDNTYNISGVVGDDGTRYLPASMIKLIIDVNSAKLKENNKSEIIFTVPATVGDDGHSYINAEVFEIIMKAINHKQEAKEEKEENISSKEKAADINTLRIKEFKNKVDILFKGCFPNGPLATNNPNSVLGEAPGMSIRFDIDKLALAKEDIQDLINKIGDFTHFSDLKVLKDGIVWTELFQDIQKLLCLATAAGIIDYKKTDDNQFDKNPVLRLKR